MRVACRVDVIATACNDDELSCNTISMQKKKREETLSFSLNVLNMHLLFYLFVLFFFLAVGEGLKIREKTDVMVLG